VRGTDSVAAYFTVARRPPDDGPLAGLIIASASAPGHVEVGVVSDAADPLASMIDPLLTKLFKAWHSSLGAAGTGLPPMHNCVLPDRTASVDLPDGWKVLPASTMGIILAEGPNGEVARLGYVMGVTDTGNPHAVQHSRWISYPFSQDLKKMFVDLTQLFRGKDGLSPARFQLATANPAPGPGIERCVHLTCQVDAEDGKGPREMNTVFCATPPWNSDGFYAPVLYYTAVPTDFADKERTSMGAILATFAVDRARIDWMVRSAYGIDDPQIEPGRGAIDRYLTRIHLPELRVPGVPGFSAASAAFDKDKRFSLYIPDPKVIEKVVKVPGYAWNKAADAVVGSSSTRFEFADSSGFRNSIHY